ncbi:Membrane-associated, eicosanoid/glutathione metabolism (MAPEG) protein [Phytophthora cinnamomi]|uniref:Membrane-associated, eicosanoid/glutathione metabolism (MAPEG) protein n=1 Tax=Phytophthora cinnamomi TaxID=4785 RepID=UPI0035599086|nr:Membrane-associated, eicosanoid/glutathione metabolism (MAPEG) protein [Phytophthora cinnamomi]
MVETNVKLYIACSSVLYLKFLLVTFIQGPKAFKSGSRPPEDILLPMAEGREQNYGLAETKDKAVFKAREEVHRWQRIIANDLESIPFALFIFGGGILAGNNDVVHAGALIVYTVSRCLHTYMYANAIQPHRSNCWFVGVAATLVGMVNAIVAIL